MDFRFLDFYRPSPGEKTNNEFVNMEVRGLAPRGVRGRPPPPVHRPVTKSNRLTCYFSYREKETKMPSSANVHGMLTHALREPLLDSFTDRNCTAGTKMAA